MFGSALAVDVTGHIAKTFNLYSPFDHGFEAQLVMINGIDAPGMRIVEPRARESQDSCSGFSDSRSCWTAG